MTYLIRSSCAQLVQGTPLLRDAWDPYRLNSILVQYLHDANKYIQSMSVASGMTVSTATASCR